MARSEPRGETAHGDDRDTPKMKLQRLAKSAQGAAMVVLQKMAPFSVQVVVSAIAYSTGLTAAQVLGKTIHVSCNMRYISSTIGFVGVGAASALAGHMGRHVQQQISSGKPLHEMVKVPFWSEMQLEEIVLDAVLGTLMFKVWGGAFCSVMPSDLRHPGAFAYQSLPVGAAEHAGSSDKSTLVQLFRRDGCHTCGSRRGKVIGDHMPPTKLFREAKAAQQAATGKVSQLMDQVRTALKLDPPLKQRYYAQCIKCSNRQGNLLAHGKISPVQLHRLIVPPGVSPGIILGMRAWIPTGAFPPAPPPPTGRGGGSRRTAVAGESPHGQLRNGAGGGRGGMWGWAQRMDEQPGGADVFHSINAGSSSSSPAKVQPSQDEIHHGLLSYAMLPAPLLDAAL